MKLYGLMITRDDHEVFGAWCDDQLSLYDAVVCLDGSTSDGTARLARQFAGRLIYLHERDFDIPHKTDHGLRRVVHREIVRSFGSDNWIMCCHADEFCYHDPRKIAERAEREEFGLVSWFSPHFYPHPSELDDWEERSRRPFLERFQHYHWSHIGNGWPWVEDRLYRNRPEVAWDDVTHGSVRPRGVGKEAPYHPIFRHYKVIGIDLGAYERNGDKTYYRHHWSDQEHRTGLAFPVRHAQDLFVSSVPKYARCDRFAGTFDQPWNMGENYRPDLPRQHELAVGHPAPQADSMIGRGGLSHPSPTTADETRTVSPLPRPYRVACRLAMRGHTAAARRVYERLADESLEPRIKALVANDLAVLGALAGDRDRASLAFERILSQDPACTPARLNFDLLRSEPWAGKAPTEECSSDETPAPRVAAGSVVSPPCPVRVAILSFLFNWPSTGGGIVHTVELANFLATSGFDVRHIFAQYPEWGVGRVEAPLSQPTEAIEFDESTWNLPEIKQRFRRAVDAFAPDYVVITDSWNIKPHLAEAMLGYPYILRLQAMECLCPLNNVRLLPEPGGRFRQCPLLQLANSDECGRCVARRGQFSGSLHQAERALSGVGSPGYHELLLRAFQEAEAVLVVNPLTEAMVSPYARSVKVVTAGMDPARFPWPFPDETRARQADGRKVLFFAGLVDEWMKGYRVLHDACRLLWQRRRDFELVATGDPPGRLDEFTRFIGWQSQEDLPAHLRAADILVMPTVAQEALGRTVVEAMAAGRPVVASRIGGLPFTVADGATGLLVEPGDPVDLARKIETLLDDPGLRARMGRAGRRRFEEHFSWDVIIEKHYRPLLTRRPRSSAADP
jgi:glycosyltransferase involved in cell wall biosynthesis